jgi:hypothetical protein
MPVDTSQLAQVPFAPIPRRATPARFTGFFIRLTVLDVNNDTEGYLDLTSSPQRLIEVVRRLDIGTGQQTCSIERAIYAFKVDKAAARLRLNNTDMAHELVSFIA